MGETMTAQTRQNLRYPTCRRVQVLQDFFLVSSFALWAVVLGLSPVLAFHMLIRG
jgi:hypothetical protein